MQTPSWKSWDATDPNREVPSERTISIFRNARTGTRYGICFGDLLPADYHVRDNGQIDLMIPGVEEKQDPVFTQWVSVHNLFAVVSFCIRHGLPRPPKEWNGVLPKWVSDLFGFHENKETPRGEKYLSNPSFDYFPR